MAGKRLQIFHDDFHLRTLGLYLSATAQLHPKVNIKQIVISLIDRLAAYAAREADSEPPEETEKPGVLGEDIEKDDQKLGENEETDTIIGENASDVSSNVQNEDADHEKEESETQPEETVVRKFRGIPEDVKLFEVFWGQIVDLVKVRLFSKW